MADSIHSMTEALEIVARYEARQAQKRRRVNDGFRFSVNAVDYAGCEWVVSRSNDVTEALEAAESVATDPNVGSAGVWDHETDRPVYDAELWADEEEGLI